MKQPVKFNNIINLYNYYVVIGLPLEEVRTATKSDNDGDDGDNDDDNVSGRCCCR